MINVYNNTASAVTCDIMVIEVGHNWIDPTMWATYSTREAIVNLVNNCSLLVGNYSDYRVYCDALDNLFNICISSNVVGNIKAIENADERVKLAQEQLESIQASEVEMDLFVTDFENDSKTNRKLLLVKEQLEGITQELESIIEKA